MARTDQPRDPTDRAQPLWQSLLQDDGAQTPLRACLLSGGASRRMGTDKALLPHPEGGTWLERTLQLLLQLEIPVTLLSRHGRHLQLARALHADRDGGSSGDAAASTSDIPRGGAGLTAPPYDAAEANPHGQAGAGESAPPPRRDAHGPSAAGITALNEPPPWQGPLLALHRLMQRHPDERLLLCPVDMPALTTPVLRTLLQAAAEQPLRIHLAHDGQRRQPLLGVYPSPLALRDDLSAALARGERRLQGWLAAQDCLEVRLEPAALRNVNRPEEMDGP